MSISVNSNTSAILALLNLNRTSDAVTAATNQTASGLKVAQSRDNAPAYALAQSQRADIASLSAVTDSLNRASSVADVALAAGQKVSDLLNQIKATALAATDPSADAASRSADQSQFTSLLGQVGQAVSSASFNGVNLLDGSQPAGVKFLASADARQTVTLSAQDLTTGGPLLNLSTQSLSTTTQATAALATVGSAIANVNGALASIGAQADQIDAHAGFVSKLAGTLTDGVGGLVDADLTQESAMLAALQVQQQLGTQSLSIANQSPSVLLSLLRG